MAVSGKYKITLNTPMGAQTPILTLKEDKGTLSGSMVGELGDNQFSGGKVEGNKASWNMDISAMGMQVSLSCEATIDGNNIKGTMSSPMGGADFSGQRES